MTLPQGANQRWSLDFVSDVLVDGRRFRVLVIVDDFTREALALYQSRGPGPRTSLQSGPNRPTIAVDSAYE